MESQIEESPRAPKRLDAASSREVRAKDAFSIAHEDAEAEGLASVGCETEVDVEVAAGRREPWRRPPHAFLVPLDISERGARHQRKRGITRVEMGEMADLIDNLHQQPFVSGLPPGR